MIDIHMHTNYSDGTDSLIDILKNCQSNNLEVISITDHNTCNAYLELDNIDFKEYYKGKIIVGCEFTTTYKGKLIEVLGYGFDYKNINEFLKEYYKPEKLAKDVKTLYDRLIQKTKELNLTFEESKHIEKKFDSEFFERRIYDELVKYEENKIKINEDIMSSFSDFFRKGLTNPKSKMFINHAEFKPKLEDIIDIVHKNNGKVFLAHPYQYKFNNEENFINEIYNDYRLDGIECFYTNFSAEQTEYLLRFAKNRELLICGGSDYHGINKRNFDLGNLNISKSILDNWNVDYFN